MERANTTISKVCILCGREIHGDGNNPSPLAPESFAGQHKGRCCDECDLVVILARDMNDIAGKDRDAPVPVQMAFQIWDEMSVEYKNDVRAYKEKVDRFFEPWKPLMDNAQGILPTNQSN
jgi:hypothetical protein